MHVAFIFGCHSLVSISLTLLNKRITLEVPHPWMVVLLQCLAAVPLTLFADTKFKQIRPASRSHLPKASLLAVLFALCLTSSLLGLARVHVPMVVVGKNLTPFITGLLEALVLGAPLSLHSVGALILGVFGSGLYAFGDASAEPIGLLFVIGNSVIVAITAVCEKHVVGTMDQSALGLSLYRNILAVPFLCIAFLVGLDDIAAAGRAIQNSSIACRVAFLLSAVFSSLAGVLVFTLQGRVRATTCQIAGLCYKIATTMLSLAFFPKSRRDIGGLAIFGYALSTMGVALYAWPLGAGSSIRRVSASESKSASSGAAQSELSAPSMSVAASSRVGAARTRTRSASMPMGSIAEESGDQCSSASDSPKAKR